MDNVVISKPICFEIPLLINQDRIPQPEPWVTSEALKENFVKDLQVLASIDVLATRLSPELRQQVQGTVRRSAESGGLPEGMNIDFGKETKY
jgi:hypothetical protein